MIKPTFDWRITFYDREADKIDWVESRSSWRTFSSTVLQITRNPRYTLLECHAHNIEPNERGDHE